MKPDPGSMGWTLLASSVSARSPTIGLGRGMVERHLIGAHPDAMT